MLWLNVGQKCSLYLVLWAHSCMHILFYLLGTKNLYLFWAWTLIAWTFWVHATATGEMGLLSTLLKWNDIDPPSREEKLRNERVCKFYQHNRNPFVDHPEYARLIWRKYFIHRLPSSHEIHNKGAVRNKVSILHMLLPIYTIHTDITKTCKFEVC